MQPYPGHDDDLNACAALVERGDPDRFTALLTAPVWARARLLPLYAFNVEVARAPWVVQEPMLGQIRLKWWEEAVDEIAAGVPVRAHQVVRPLADLVQQVGLSIDGLRSMITARGWDIAGEQFATQSQLVDHIAAGSGVLSALGATALGAPAPVVASAWQVGTGQGIAAWLSAVAQMTARGMNPLPDASESGIISLADQGLAPLRAHRRTNFAAATPALRAGWQAGALLRLARAQPDLVRSGNLHLSEFRKRGSLLYRSITGGW